MGLIPRLALLGSAAWCFFALKMFTEHPHFTADPELKSSDALKQWDETYDIVLGKKGGKSKKKEKSSDDDSSEGSPSDSTDESESSDDSKKGERWNPKDGTLSFIMLAGAMYGAVGALFLCGALAWGPSGSFARALLNLWSLVFCAVIIYVNTVWPLQMGSDVRSCDAHSPQCLKSASYLLKPENLPLVLQMALNLLGLLLRERTVIHKIYAEKISTGTISDPLLP